MRTFSLGLLIFLLSSCTNNGSAQQLVITSGYSSVIQFFLLDLEADDPTLYEYGQQDVDPNLTFIDIFSDGRTIYTVHEVEDYDGQGQKSGAVSRWLKGRDVFGKPELNKAQTVTFPNGGGTCHVALQEDYGLIHISNYVGGSFVSYKIDQGTGEIMDQAYSEHYGPGSNVKPDRQKDAHAHGAFTFGPFVYVADLGSDKIWHYVAGTDGTLSKADPAFTSTPPGYGPRHMAIHEDLKLAYIIFELESYIGIYTIDEESGALTEKEMVQLLPNPASTDYAAEIEICSDKKFLYASNRKTDDSNGAIVVFEIKNDGSLERIQVQPVMGSTPRHFKMHPDNQIMLVGLTIKVISNDRIGNEISDIDEEKSLQLLKRDPVTGLLSENSILNCPSAPTVVGLLNL